MENMINIPIMTYIIIILLVIMGSYTTIGISESLRKKLGKKCPKDLSFSDFIENIIDKYV